MNENQALIDGLRAAADFMENNDVGRVAPGITLYRFFSDKDEFINGTRGFGRLEKKPLDSYYTLVKMFPGEVEFQFTIGRELICEKVVVKKTVPAEPAKPEREVDVVEWICPPSLLDKARRDVQPSPPDFQMEEVPL